VVVEAPAAVAESSRETPARTPGQPKAGSAASAAGIEAAATAPAVQASMAATAEAPVVAAAEVPAVTVETLATTVETPGAAVSTVAAETEDPAEPQALLDSLRRSVERSIAEAEGLGAALSAPDSWRRANTLYLQGVEALQRLDLDRASERLGAARDAVLELLELARARRDEERLRAQRLMLQVMGELEEASGLTVVTEDGTLIPPEPWSGRPYLEGEVRR
jgi:hypothetical protein